MTAQRTPEEDLASLLADDGGELGSLYRRLPRVDPPRRLDRAVLGEAARAVQGRPPRRQRWLVGFGSAAGIVLAAGVAWHVGQEGLRQQSHEPTPGGATYVPVEPLTESARSRHEASAPAVADTPTAALSNAAPPGTPQREAVPVQDKAPLRRATRSSGEVLPAVPRKPAPALPLPPPQPSAPPQPVARPEQRGAGAIASDADARSTLGAAQSAAPAESNAKDEPSAAARAPSSSGASPSTSVELRRDMQLAPVDWLARIEQLLHQGRRQQAIESLQLFRRVHPDWALSDELRALGD